MELFAAIYTDTDGFTFTCETVLGVFDTQEAAEAALADLKSVHRTNGHGVSRDTDYEVRAFNLNERLDW